MTDNANNSTTAETRQSAWTQVPPLVALALMLALSLFPSVTMPRQTCALAAVVGVVIVVLTLVRPPLATRVETRLALAATVVLVYFISRRLLLPDSLVPKGPEDMPWEIPWVSLLAFAMLPFLIGQCRERKRDALAVARSGGGALLIAWALIVGLSTLCFLVINWWHGQSGNEQYLIDFHYSLSLMYKVTEAAIVFWLAALSIRSAPRVRWFAVGVVVAAVLKIAISLAVGD